MANKFNEFSKHLAQKQTRRGALKFMGAGLISAFVATVFARGSADADRRRRYLDYLDLDVNATFNGTIIRSTTVINDLPFNKTIDDISILDKARSYRRRKRD